MKTPNQLSEPEISRICENWPGSALNAAREIEAAVNAKWTEMLGAVEPVGYVDADDIKHREDMFCTVTPSKIRKQPIYTHPAPTAEPVNKQLLGALKQVRLCVPPAQRAIVNAAIAESEGRTAAGA